MSLISSRHQCESGTRYLPHTMTQHCPRCGSQNVYIGIEVVECENAKCSLYVQKKEVEQTPVLGSLAIGGRMHQDYDDFTDEAYWAELMFNHD